MRKKIKRGDFRAFVVAGTHTILIALDCVEERRKGLLGFAFKRQRAGEEPRWLRSLKTFESVSPAVSPNDADYPRDGYRSNEHPIQSFLWSDYTALPGKTYRFSIYPVYGEPASLWFEKPLDFEITTETERDATHCVWFNRGAIASQALEREVKQGRLEWPTDETCEDPGHPTTTWLSRGLLEACLRFIDETPASQKLRVCAYELTYLPVIRAFRRALERGVDIQLIVHDDKEKKNRKALKKAGLKLTAAGHRVVHWRTKTRIPHNKFIVRLNKSEKPTHVWTGSTNLTASGFLGQSNVGHLVNDPTTANQFMKYWHIIAANPTRAPAVKSVAKISPYPPALPPKTSTTCVFSPRGTASMLNWYADKMSDASQLVMFTAAFTVADDFVEPLARDRDFLRYILKEKPPTAAERRSFSEDRDLLVAYGGVLGTDYTVKDGRLLARRKAIQPSPLEKWYLLEEHYRDKGNIFFIHTKFLLIDALCPDPLVCTGSANFSENSLINNDENMLLIRGDTRVADIYLTEYDRLFRHFYFRNVANQTAAKKKLKSGYLSEDSRWTDSYFTPGAFKTRRREMFFGPGAPNWSLASGDRSNDEPVRP